MGNLTEKQREVLGIIQDFITVKGISPTVREIADRCGIKSTSTVHGYLKRLEREGYISKIKESPRSIKVNV